MSNAFGHGTMDSRFGSPFRVRLVVLWLSGLLFAWQSWCSAQSVMLTWTPSASPNVVGYNIYYGTASGNYTTEVSIGALTNLTVSGLAFGGTYYFAAAAVNSSGVQSALSTQTSYTVPEPIPSISITNVTSGMSVTNGTLKMMGLASDTVGVANVYCSLNGAPYTAVAPVGSQWSASLTLASGTNTFAVYAMDTLGNKSATDTVSVIYIEMAALAVSATGQGSVSPNYNGDSLQVGQIYKMTATPVAGFMFTNWTGGITVPSTTYTNGPTVQFVMANNLVMQANFVDTIKPSISITNIPVGLQVSNSTFTVMGIATNNVAVSDVQYSLNGASFAPAALIGNSWSAALTLVVGTNTVAAFATDTNGNVSATNKASIDYFEASALTVETKGKGNIGPNYNGQHLRIGASFAMTAAASTGFVFTNWTGATNGTYTVVTNSPTVQFTMVTNLVLQANFNDTLAPYLAITNLTSGMLWTNPTFTVMGVATDDEAIASVNFSLNGASYAQAMTNGIQWNTGPQTLTPGTNIFSIYAQATNGNLSVTDRVALVYAVSNQLQIQISGRGYVSPNYSNAWLRVGENYTMTATPAPGMLFTNWTGSTNGIGSFVPYTKTPTVQFMMFPNLVMQANFRDTLKPYLAITNVPSGTVWTNPTFTVMGVATDDEAMASVNYSLNGSPWLPVNKSNNWTNWNETLQLQTGTNLLSVYALATNNNAITDSVDIVYAVSNRLQIQISGRGYVSPNYSNVWLRLGENYAMTATPAPGMLFTNWTGSTNGIGSFVPYTKTPTVQFMMFPNLVMQANFLDTLKPYLAITNVTSGMLWTNPTFTVTGVATDDEAMASVNYSLNGSPYLPVNTVNNWTNWNETLQLQAGTNLLTVYALATNNNAITDRVDIVYAVSNQLQIQISGRGYVSPNYSNAWLRVGENYTMTATPAPGMLFTNWTGSTNGIGSFVPYTKTPTVQFMMFPNLVMQANFRDTLKPYLAITNVTSGMLWTNPTFTVTGVATDDEAMASVNYSLNGSPYLPVNTVNNWTNWNETLQLQAGTNLLTVYALATNNDTVTDRVDIVYAVSNRLQIQISGRGYVSPNYSNAWLRLGENYAMTATPAPGMLFTNWTGSTNGIGSFVPYTKTPTVQFMMFPNLVMQANFLDTLKPYLAITNVTSGMLWTNPTFTVMGVATDDEAMASVNYSLNGSPYLPVNTVNNWTNWNETLQLQAGTNLLTVYALATNNNAITDRVDIVYAVSNQLQIQISGRGYVSPNYSNAWLRVGENYTMTATPAPGMLFTNWTGSTNGIGSFVPYTKTPTVQFMMFPNLVMQANFRDTLKPYLAITNVTSGMLWTNPTFTVTGVATDDEAMASVNYSLNGSPYLPVNTANNWTNWNETLQLHAGTNFLSVYALATNNNAITQSVDIVYAVSNKLSIEAEGLGFLSPNYSNAWLRIGQNYSIAATPDSGFAFTNWVISTNFNFIGGATTNKPTVQFTMASNLTLQVNFAETAKPTLTVLSPASGTREPTASATVTGTAKDVWGVAIAAYQLNSGPWTPLNSTNSFTNWTATVQLNAGTNIFRSCAMNLGGNFSPTNTLTLISTNSTPVQFSLVSQPASNNGFNFTLKLEPGLSGRIEVSTDLIDWNVLTNFTETNGTVNITDPNATTPRRFYRAIVP